MAAATDWNSQVIAEFRANSGKLGGQFEGAPVAILHHRGRKSGREFLVPVMYLADDADPIIRRVAKASLIDSLQQTRDAVHAHSSVVLAMKR